jgi:hypothetical protein
MYIMSYYKIETPHGTFRASIEETQNMYKIKYGGRKACVFFSVYKGYDEEYPNLDGLGTDKRCNVEESLDDTVILFKSSLKFLIWRFSNIKYVQFLDTSKKECAGGIQIDLATFHFAKHGKTWYEDKFGARPLDKSKSKYFRRASEHLDNECPKDGFDTFYKENVMRFVESFQKVKKEDVYDMLKICWEDAITFKDFFKQVGSKDCILFQQWLKTYIISLWRHVTLDVVYWKISKKIIDSWDMDIKIRSTSTRPNYISNGGDGSGALFGMKDFLSGRKR